MPDPQTSPVVLIKGGRILDPASGRDEIADLLVMDGRIADLGPQIERAGARVLDARGLLVCPGLVDIHVHLREPGQEAKETIRSGARAAAAGGFTTVCAMPNTEPPLDTGAWCAFVADAGVQAGAARVLPIGCVSRGRRGQELGALDDMVGGGACAFSDDGDPVPTAGLMRDAIAAATRLDRVIIDHCEDRSLTAGGQMHEGEVSAALGLRGLPALGEDVMVARDILIAEALGARVHIAHISTARSIALVRNAKRRGVRVSCEVTAHHLLLTDEACRDRDPARHKMHPPLRSERDRQAAVAGLLDGTIDAIASDHAPHTRDEKRRGWEQAPNGILGLETTLPVVYTDLVEPGILPLARAIEALTAGPVRCLGLADAGRAPASTGTLAPGAAADITVIDTSETYTLGATGYRSLSANSPFTGRAVRGRARWVLVGGRVVHDSAAGAGA